MKPGTPLLSPFPPPMEAAQLLPGAWGLHMEPRAAGCLEGLKVEGGHFSGALASPSWRAGPGTPRNHCISLYSWAESAVLEGPSAPCAWRHHCGQLFQAALTAPPVCTGEGPRAHKPKVQNPRLCLLKGLQRPWFTILLTLLGQETQSSPGTSPQSQKSGLSWRKPQRPLPGQSSQEGLHLLAQPPDLPTSSGEELALPCSGEASGSCGS